ncbi:hypothetical protein WOLCODRAFT_142517 [Wolfiporia cocos MD-104 SS10]|uniref:Uncharacterized protein n=1 Tax=Wolfiporia cocos (strain MD-104) TaxID=742152 RepID=A0A2H3J7Z3_WOLCO|nr:hypothetical protein WOLCODRAFT_142517 [Wolfiporia cocos MD-104 SS10]
MYHISSNALSLTCRETRRHSVPYTFDFDHADSGYEADAETDHTTNIRASRSSRRNRINARKTQSLPPCLRNLHTSHRVADNMAIHVELTDFTQPSRTDFASRQGLRATSSPQVPSTHTTTHTSGTSSRPGIGLGLSLPTAFSIPCHQTPVVSTASAATTAVARAHSRNNPTITMQRTDSGSSTQPYSIRPPGLSSPVPSDEDAEHWWEPVGHSHMRGRQGLPMRPLSPLAAESITIEVVLPTPPLSLASSMDSTSEADTVPPGAPRMRTIDHFPFDPLYT